MSKISLTPVPNLPVEFRAEIEALERAGSSEGHFKIEAATILTDGAIVAPQNDSFDRWFADSKAVDSVGRPMVVYHGTTKDFTEFSPDKSKSTGIFFSATPEYANIIAELNGAREGNANVIPAYIRVVNPKYISSEDFSHAAIAEAKDAGHDGLITILDGRPTQFTVFEANQIKSSIGNNGNFDPDHPDIRYLRERAEAIAFNNWFGDSRVVDAEGNPRRVYHGTDSNFTQFQETTKGTLGSGIYFLDKESDAAAYGETAMPVYLSIQKPWVIDIDPDSEGAFEEDFDSPSVEAVLSLPNGRDLLDAAKNGDGMYGPALKAALTREGYDGIIGTYPDGSMEIVAFKQTQIKSASENNGSYDPNNPDIRFLRERSNSVAFNRWFADSKILNDAGAPLVMYHGTSTDFTIFSKKGVKPNFNSPQKHLGFFFTDSAKYAGQYAGTGFQHENASIMPVYLSLKNPKFESIEKIDEIEDSWSQTQAKEYRAELQEQGYDGIVFEGETKGFGFSKEVVAFSPESIKSAIGNNGDFNPAQKDIRFQRGLLPETRPMVSDIFEEQIEVDGQWFHAQRIFGRAASTFKIGDVVSELAREESVIDDSPDEYVTSSLFRESGANVSHTEEKISQYADAMDAYGGWGKFPPIVGRIFTVTSDDVQHYERLNNAGIASELAYSRPLLKSDIGKRIVHVENGHNRSYAASRRGIEIPVYDLEKQELNDPAILRTNAAVGTEDQTKKPEFLIWFSESKVVDSGNKPLVVYHGTNAHAYVDGQINVFNTRPESGRGGAFFTSDAALANQYGERTYPVYLCLQNPLVVHVNKQGWSAVTGNSRVEGLVPDALRATSQADANRMSQLYAELEDLFGEAESVTAQPKIGSEATLDGLTLQSLPGLDGSEFETDTVVKAARKFGFDGVIFRDVQDSPTTDSSYEKNISDVFVVFSPAQIKSATLNNGEFDPSNNDIRFLRTQKTTPAFDKWFGESKVIGNDGQPLLMYHGTNQEFTEFDSSRSISWKGKLFFTTDKELAQHYGAITMEVYLKAERIKYVTDSTAFIEALNDPSVEQDFDGIEYTDVSELGNPIHQMVVFSPSQVRTAKDAIVAQVMSFPSAAATKAEQLEKEHFDLWFGESKIVDETNKPLVLYHGTDAQSDFNIFEPSAEGFFGSGIYFTADRDAAIQFAVDKYDAEEPRVIDAYVSMQNPYVFNAPPAVEEPSNHTLAKELFRGTELKKIMKILESKTWDNPTNEFKEKLISMGHDGLIVHMRGEHSEYIAFESTQIKSADKNNGEFDAKNADIRFHRALVSNEVARESGDAVLRLDNPGGEWLREKRSHVVEDGLNRFGTPASFGPYTGSFKRHVLLPVALLRTFKGMRNEESNVRQADLDSLVEHGRVTGRFPVLNEDSDATYDPMIQVDMHGNPWVHEGNHRIMAAEVLAWDYVPVDLRYYAGGEAANGALSPDVVIEHDRAARAAGCTPVAYGGMKQALSFTDWFGDSKVVDSDGKPRVVYHGTRYEFDTFEPSKPRAAFGNPVGIYFTSDRREAELFAADVDGATDDRSRVIEVYLSIQSDKDGVIRERNDGTTEYIVFDPTKIKAAAEVQPVTPEAIKDSPEFNEWFADSIVVDANGKPMVVYHGTTHDFVEFNTGSELGAHFGSVEQANEFAFEENARVIPAFIALKNPIRLSDHGDFYAERVLAQLRERGIAEQWMTGSQFGGVEGKRVIQRMLKRAGFDGIIYLNRREGINPFDQTGITPDILNAMSDEEVNQAFPAAQDSYIVFEPAQIKSAIGFDAAYPAENVAVAVTDRPAFKNWFAGSRIVDADGNPMVVYHGTSAAFTEFRKDAIGSNYTTKFGEGFYFTDSLAAAEVYSKESIGAAGRSVVHAYLSLKNPLIVNDVSEFRTAVSDERDRRGTNVIERDRLLRKSDAEILADAGFDGVIYLFKGEMSEIVAFKPEQIKSVDNNGDFDATKSDIRFSRMLNKEHTPELGNIVDRPEFKNWFGASKVVEPDGSPMVVFHNTDADFTVFKAGVNSGLGGNGIYFSEYPLPQFGSRQIKAYLRIENPITRETELPGMRELNSAGIPTKFIDDIFEKFPEFDGIINRSEIVVKSLDQIKSVDNNGDFDPSNNDIRFSRAFNVKQDTPEEGSIAQRPDFKNWFDGSKIVAADGQPMIVYHGSPDIRGILQDGFKPSMSRGQVFFAAKDYEVANSYADDHRAFDYQNAEPHTLSLYLAIKNPMIVDAKRQYWRDTERHVEEAKNAGHDGIIIINSVDFYNNPRGTGKTTTVYAWFEPTQAKFAMERNLISRVDGADLGGGPDDDRMSATHPQVHFPDVKITEPVEMDATQLPAFKEWFGNSKLVSGEGKPLVFYHGTENEFNTFDESRTGESQEGRLFNGRGFYFADTKFDAGMYGSNVMPVYLRMENPLDLRDKAAFMDAFSDLVPRGQEKTLGEIAADYQRAKDALNIEDVLVKEIRPGFFNVQWKIDGDWKSDGGRPVSILELADDTTGRQYAERRTLPISPDELLSTGAFSSGLISEAVRSKGFDGVINYGGIGHSGDEFIVLSPSQIKSVANTGNFDLADPDIRFQRATVIAEPESAFKDWFGGSKIVDGEGKPMVMYHGTYNGEIAEFDRLWSTKVRRPSMDTVGIWFSNNPGEGGAEMYANGQGAAIYPVYLKAEKTKYYDRFEDFLREMHEAEGRRFEDQNPKGAGSAEGLRTKLKTEGYDSIGFLGNNVSELYAEVEELKDAIQRAQQEYRDEAQRMRDIGMEMSMKDGLPFQAKIDRLVEKRMQVTAEIDYFGRSTEFDKQIGIVVFEPTQIKSSIGNFGDYDPENADIRFQRTAQPIAVRPQSAFDNWFAGSQIVDDDGKPLEVFHGTRQRFTAFNSELAGTRGTWPSSSMGFFFSPKIWGAEVYGDIIISAYLSIKNPYRLSTGDHYEITSTDEAITMRENLIARGFDGVIVGENQEIIAFYPNQIKHSRDNIGDYDPSIDDIRFSRDGIANTAALEKWMPASKVRDEAGKPLVLFHGTNDVIESFDAAKTVDGGIHFGTAVQANMRAAGTGKNLYPVYLNVTNPKRLRDSGGNWKAKIASAKASGHDGIVYLNRYEGMTTERVTALSDAGMLDRLDSMSDTHFKKAVPEAKDSYIVFASTQILSAFDPVLQAAASTVKQHQVAEIREENTDAYSGQSNFRMRAYIGGRVIGYLDYVKYQDEISISMIQITPAFKRQGHATVLVQQLQRQYPDTEIRWGMLTGDGAALYDSVKKTVVERPDIIAKQTEHRRLLRERERMQKLADAFHEIAVPTEAQRLALYADLDTMNEIHDAIDAIENDLRGERASKVMIALPDTLLAEADSTKFLRGNDDQIPAADKLKNELAIVKELAGVFGSRVALFRQSKDSDFRFNGVMTKKTIWLNEESEFDLPRVFGHELLHLMRSEKPALYQGLASVLEPLLINEARYIKSRRLQDHERELVVEEMIADLLGDRFTERSFWALVAEKNPTIFSGVASFVTKLIDKVKDKFARPTFQPTLGSDLFISDLDTARDVLADVVVEYAHQKRSESRPGFFEGVHAAATKWIKGAAPEFDVTAVSNLLAENIDDELKSLYTKATGREAKYVDVFEWVSGPAFAGTANKEVLQELLGVAINRGYEMKTGINAMARKIFGTAVKTDSPAASKKPPQRPVADDDIRPI